MCNVFILLFGSDLCVDLLNVLSINILFFNLVWFLKLFFFR